MNTEIQSSKKPASDELLTKLRQLILAEQEHKIFALEQKIAQLEDKQGASSAPSNLSSGTNIDRRFHLLQNQLSERLRQESNLQQRELRSLAHQVANSAQNSTTAGSPVTEQSSDDHRKLIAEMTQATDQRVEKLKEYLIKSFKEALIQNKKELKKEIQILELRSQEQLNQRLQQIATAFQSPS